MSIKVLPKNFSKGIGYDLQVANEDATVQDYLDAINQYILEGNFTRLRQQVKQCEGCEGCCAERIPLTIIDLYNLQKALELGQGELPMDKIISKYTYVQAEGPVVDIALGQNSAGNCLFLDPKEKRCTIYGNRPLVCQTYICAPASPRAQKLREKIVNMGEDQLVKWCLENIPQDRLFHEAWEPRVRIEDWENTPFADKKNYSEVPLKNICPPKFWQALKG
ncbi:YkgJ family cysteine cluster protein [Bacillota bacterium LX-D]|nr:YkgJ family cysteine cluster protein [Bacillota bacterium LX-D]